MIGAWMLYAIAVSLLLALAALAVERVLQLQRRAARGVWVAALLLSVTMPLTLALLGSRAPSPVTPDAAGSGSAGAGRGAAARVESVGALPDSLLLLLDRALLFLWLLATLALLARLLVAAVALRRARRSWRAARLQEHPVLLSRESGPAVVGFFRPGIVLPEWILAWEPALQRLVLEHESEHIRARDPALLLLGWGALLLQPWNLPLWWQMRRLRLAIEFDCDARVLRSAPDVGTYGRVLLEVGRQASSARLRVAAFSEPRSTLERRIRMMTRPKTRASRAALLGALGVAALLPVALYALPAPGYPTLEQLAEVARRGEDPVPAGPAAANLPAPTEAVDTLPLPPLPGEPDEATVEAALRRHHPQLWAQGTRPGEIVWFITGAGDEVLHTGVERATEEQLVQRLRSRYPAQNIDFVLFQIRDSQAGAPIHLAWFIPPPEGLP